MPLNIAAKWQQAEENAVEHLEAWQEKQSAAFRLDGPVGIVFVSDQHISPGTLIDFKRMREDAELIRETPHLKAVLGGDGVDNHLKHFAAILAQRSTPDDQYELFDHYLGMFGDRGVLAMINGNHDKWTVEKAGIDVTRMLARARKIVYNPSALKINLIVGKQPYMIVCRHQYRFNSSFNQGHTVKQLWAMGFHDFDIGCVCHHHEAHVESFERHGVTRWACRPGSYQYATAYSNQYGYNPAKPTCPTFVLHPAERQIIGFRDVRDALPTLDYLRRKFLKKTKSTRSRRRG